MLAVRRTLPQWPRIPHAPVRLRWPTARSASTQPDSRREPPAEPRAGTTTPAPDDENAIRSSAPFYFEAGFALYAKRPPRPFPPPFMSPPSGSFSDPLSTHHKSRDRRAYYNGEMIRGVTNGDDAVLVSDNLVAANDGVGAWATKDHGHAGLWSRLILHFWALEAEKDRYGASSEPRPVEYLQRAYEQTTEATAEPTAWYGTTTASSALLGVDVENPPQPVVYVTQLGDSQVMVIRPADRTILFKTKEQWHWFDCPRQLGTNSPDSPTANAVMDKVHVREGDVVLVTSDGVGDNLWDHEVLQNVLDSLHKWDHEEAGARQNLQSGDRMRYVAQELMQAARVIAEDPFAESPYMEKAVDEGLGIEGGKLDDISVVAALCRRRNG